MMLANLNLFLLIIVFLIGYFLASKLYDFISTKNKSYKNSSIAMPEKDLEDLDQENERENGFSNLDVTSLSVLTLISKYSVNLINENFDYKINIIQKFFSLKNNLQQINREKIIQILYYSEKSNTTLDQIIYKIKTLRRKDKSFYIALTQLLLDLSLVDGILSADEELTLLKVCIEFDIAENNAYKLYKENFHFRENDDYFISQSDKDKYFGKVLGLDGKVTKIEISKKYKELVLKYHPDKVSHLGEEFQLFAEIKIKEINSAYEYLKKRFNIH